MPLSLLNIKSGQPELVEDYQVEELVRGGTHIGYGDSATGIILGDGTQYNIPASKLADALSLPGVKYQSPDMADAQEFAESGGGQAAAGAAGIARSLTFGGSDWLLKSLGAADTARALREENPWTSLIGEGVGIAAPLLLGGPLGAVNAAGRVAKVAGTVGKTGVKVTPLMAGARKVGALPRTAAEVGVRAGRWFQNAAHPVVKNTKVQRFMADRVSQGIAAGIEGGIYGGGIILSDAALGTDPITSEKIAATMTATVALGAGLGAAIGSGTLKAFRKRGPLKPTRAERKGRGSKLQMLQKKWVPHTLPYIAAVKSVMDLSPNKMTALSKKMRAYADATKDSVGSSVKTPTDSMELVGETLMDETFWTKVRNHHEEYSGDLLEGFYIEAPIQKLGSYGIIPRLKTGDEMSETLGYGMSYALDSINALPAKADLLPLVDQELTMYRHIFEEIEKINKQNEINIAIRDQLKDPNLSANMRLSLMAKQADLVDIPLPSIPRPEYLIDKDKIASRLSEAAEDLTRFNEDGSLKAIASKSNLTDAERATYDYLDTQAQRLNGMPIATFAEGINMRRLADTLIPYGEDGKVLLSKSQNKGLMKLRTFITEEVESKMIKAFSTADMAIPPPPAGAPIMPGAGGADALADAYIATDVAKEKVANWVAMNKLYGGMAILAKGSTEKAQKTISDVLTRTSPYLWAHILGVGVGTISGHGLLFITGSFALHIMNTFGSQLMAQLGRTLNSQASFRRAAKSTEKSLDKAVDSFFSPAALSKKTARYASIVAAGSGDGE